MFSLFNFNLLTLIKVRFNFSTRLIEVYNHYTSQREAEDNEMGKHKNTQCQHLGCSYSGRSDNMKRHMASHEKETLKYSPVIRKAKSERLNLRMPRPR